MSRVYVKAIIIVIIIFSDKTTFALQSINCNIAVIDKIHKRVGRLNMKILLFLMHTSLWRVKSTVYPRVQ